ncbi:CASP-like protein 1E1 [Typha latifolia]|uniref:CASP-like protein 1E1 n=1 Tax=Typha latifolia TaxID=4733 RepID=UPI003C2CDEAA
MESQQPAVGPPPSMFVSGGAQATASRGNLPSSSLPSTMKLLSYVLRVLPIVFTFLAAVLMGAAKEDLVVTDLFGGRSKVAKFKSLDSSALVYFVVVNVLVCVYSIASLVISLVIKKGSLNLELPISGMDMIVLVFLLTCNGAASAVAVILDAGSEDFGWLKFCSDLKHFCSLIKAAIAFSMFASFAYLLLVLLTMFRFYKRSS